ncbi:MAG: hypothetical protein M1330_01695 [Armatimonadetes bacterium]|nr:hypothetical protein [Armatimonadota bacterium]
MPTYIRPDNRDAHLIEKPLEFVRWIFRLSTIATVLLYIYLFWGIFGGQIGNAQLSADEQAHLTQVISSAVSYLNLSMGLMLLTACLLFYGEESLGYLMIGVSLLFYFGVPFLLNEMLQSQIHEWAKAGNQAAGLIWNEFRMTSLMTAVPGSIMVIYSLYQRLNMSISQPRSRVGGMRYGGSIKAEKEEYHALIGMTAKCWQLPYCRAAIRRACPIFLARTRCWRERVGCMCEENVIRHATEALIQKEEVNTPGFQLAEDQDVTPPPQPPKSQVIALSPKHIHIPHNPHLTAAQKAERCRNCVIYNEHQRLKYQVIAPIIVLGVPAVAVWQAPVLLKWLDTIFQNINQLVENISLSSHPVIGTQAVVQLVQNNPLADYFMLICLVIVVISLVLRFAEYCIFTLKI